ncbi:hypothetical protein CYLTODRAFT_410019 [Cylindrobasidium torrendii FP15055 ss-10]|uniref:Uncharacterized protein n=1 Tax=Cylindrobasidium torrendii FP15055 ss-10 TaxID=1314674 RepID=A0A0D7BFS6_9AGAR|nr:hypothetical protein CYLTODRAFT_410019 [Cylindrobasidium torrendii FP15055 ss-10]
MSSCCPCTGAYAALFCESSNFESVILEPARRPKPEMVAERKQAWPGLVSRYSAVYAWLGILVGPWKASLVRRVNHTRLAVHYCGEAKRGFVRRMKFMTAARPSWRLSSRWMDVNSHRTWRKYQRIQWYWEGGMRKDQGRRKGENDAQPRFTLRRVQDFFPTTDSENIAVWTRAGANEQSFLPHLNSTLGVKGRSNRARLEQPGGVKLLEKAGLEICFSNMPLVLELW